MSDITNDAFGLSKERWTLVRRAVRRIAADHELTSSGHRKKLALHEAINIAREVCHALGWDYSGPAATDTAGADINGTKEAPQHREADAAGIAQPLA